MDEHSEDVKNTSTHHRNDSNDIIIYNDNDDFLPGFFAEEQETTQKNGICTAQEQSKINDSGQKATNIQTNTVESID